VTILHLISSEGCYGAENMLLGLARELSQLRCRCIIAVFCDARFPEMKFATEARRQGLEVETVLCKGRWDWNVVGRIRKLLAERNVDVLHAHGYKADVYGYLAARRDRLGLLSTCHNWPNKLLIMRAYAALDRIVLRRFNQIATVSVPVAEILRRSGLPSAKIATIPNGVDLDRFRAACPTLRDEIGGASRIVGLVGRLVDGKGGALLLHAAVSVLATFPQTKFVFIGDGPLRAEWEALANRLGIRRSVVFTGTRNDMPEVYASLDVVVLPSVDEGTPMSVLEAMAAGRPVVASRVGGVPDLIVPGVTGLLIDSGDSEALSTAIVQLLEDPALAHRLGENGRLQVARRFSSRAMAKSYIALYKRAMPALRSNPSPDACELSCQ
jgi:glycosyltransferase involved in cell wall biosynthesis